MAYFLRWSTGGIVDIARRHCPLLAAEHARRRKGGGGSREAPAGCRHLHAFLRSQECIATHPLASRDHLVPAALSQALPLAAPTDADGVGEFRPARVRPGD